MRFKKGLVMLSLVLCLTSSLFGQVAANQQLAHEKIAGAYPSVVLVLASRTSGDPAAAMGAGLVVRRNGIILTAYHLVKDAQSVQVRFKSGEIFDQVQLLGVDARRDVAAIRITAAALPVLPIAMSAQAKTGDAVGVISLPEGLPWSASGGIVGGYRLSDELPGAGSGYRLVEFTAPSLHGASSGGVLTDSQGNALGLIVKPIVGGQTSNLAVPIDSVLGLADSPITRVFSSGTSPGNFASTPATRPVAAPATASRLMDSVAVPNAPEKSDALGASKDRDFILRNFKTMYVNANRATHFGSDQLKAQLGRNEDFAKLNIQIVDDPRIADTVLEVGYTFAWDYPFQLKHQNTTIVLLSGKGLGPFSGIAGAASVAAELAKLAKPYRSAPNK